MLVEPDLIFDTHTDRRGGSARQSGSHEVMDKHTYSSTRSSGGASTGRSVPKGTSPADVRWPEHTLGPDQRVSERREAYRAKFSACGEDSEDEYAVELDEATWQTLKVGQRCRLKVGTLSGEVKQGDPGGRQERRPQIGRRWPTPHGVRQIGRAGATGSANAMTLGAAACLFW